MRTAEWYYKEMDAVERRIRNAKSEDERQALEEYLDILNDEFYKL